MADLIPIEKLASMIPTSLDDVIKRKDSLQLHLATEADLSTLPSGVPEGAPKRLLRDWYVIKLIDVRSAENSAFALFGMPALKNGTWHTSALTARDGNRFLTGSGAIYEVAGPPSSEPDLLYICGWLNFLGMGRALGVAPIYL